MPQNALQSECQSTSGGGMAKNSPDKLKGHDSTSSFYPRKYLQMTPSSASEK